MNDEASELQFELVNSELVSVVLGNWEPSLRLVSRVNCVADCLRSGLPSEDVAGVFPLHLKWHILFFLSLLIATPFIY